MALKHVPPLRIICADFGTIRNNTALKQTSTRILSPVCFGTIRNNTALKPRGPIFVTTFRNRAIHLS
ncbi:hypothetical protein NNC88_03935 [Streptococcus mutans]|nr:hypothetical protein [Streptococcus mutans]MDT9560641.1 hypothetical protein [Streptococcus mutans]